MMEHNPTFINTVFLHTNHAKQNMKETYRDDKAACSTLAASLTRWDVEVGADKRAQQRNEGMTEKSIQRYTKSLV